jgi:hypothetical protein
MANRSYRLVTTLLYPASLRAALVWFAQGIWLWEITLHRHASGPSNWALAFALWFLVAYAIWFARLTDPEMGGKYSRRSLASDILDAVTTFIAFGYLGLVMSDVHETPPAVFLCSSLVSISSIISENQARSHRIRCRGRERGWLVRELATHVAAHRLDQSLLSGNSLGIAYCLREMQRLRT